MNQFTTFFTQDEDWGRYFERNWFKCSEMWALLYRLDLCTLGNNTTNRIERYSCPYTNFISAFQFKFLSQLSPDYKIRVQDPRKAVGYDHRGSPEDCRHPPGWSWAENRWGDYQIPDSSIVTSPGSSSVTLDDQCVAACSGPITKAYIILHPHSGKHSAPNLFKNDYI